MMESRPDATRRRWERDAALHAATPRLLAGFAPDGTALPRLDPALRHFCKAAAEALGAEDVAVWLHDREARELALASGPASAPQRLAVTDSASPLAGALRATRAAWSRPPADGAPGDATVPLRGRRRALGVIDVRGMPASPDEESHAPLDRLEALARPLAAAIEQVQLLDEVIRSRREMESTFNALADLVAVTDRAGRLVQVNDAFATRVGDTRDTIVGRHVAAYLAADTATWLINACDQVMQTGVVRYQDITDSRLSGTFFVTISRRIGIDGTPVGTVLLARDVTRQRQLEKERASLDERLAQTQKLAALGQFVAGIAHELNNPLQGILGHVDLIRASGDLPKQVTRDLRLIAREAERAARIIRDLLVFARSGTPRARRPLRISAVLARIVTLRADAWKAAHIDVVRSIPATLPKIAGVPLLLQQAFLNIVLNAEQALASCGGGQLVIEATHDPQTDRIVVDIRDTGPGIPADVLPRVFEPFFTTKSVGQGTGLGLALTYGIIQDHGGDIVARNYLAGGAQFTVYLPVFPHAGNLEPR